MNGNSLSEQVLAKTTQIAELLRDLKIEDTEENKAIYMQMAVLNNELTRLGQRRLAKTVGESVRRTEALIALHGTPSVPRQRG